MMTTTLRAGAMALAIGAALAGVKFAQSQQLGTGDDVLGRGGAVLGAGEAATGEAVSVEGQQAVAPAALGECVTNRTAFRTQTNQVSTTSGSFVVMPNTHFPVTTSGGCLVVDFAGIMTMSTATGNAVIRAFIVGTGQAEPNGSGVVVGPPAAANFYELKSMRFVFPNVPPGTYTVRIEYRALGDNTVFARDRTLTVQYRP